MIHLLDELTLDAGDLQQVLHLLDEELLPGRAQPLPQLLNRWVSPPVVVPGVPSTLWLLWQLPDARLLPHARQPRFDAGGVAEAGQPLPAQAAPCPGGCTNAAGTAGGVQP